MGRWGPDCGQHRYPYSSWPLWPTKGGKMPTLPAIHWYNTMSQGKMPKMGTHAITMVKERVVDWIIRFNS